MEIRIDEGIRLAQRRLIQRAIYDHQALVFSQNGKIVEQVPQGSPDTARNSDGDPMYRYRYKKCINPHFLSGKDISKGTR